LKPPQWLPVLAIALSVGFSFLHLAAALTNMVTAEYIDHDLSQVVWEYGFRAGGKYGLLTISMIMAGTVLCSIGLAIGFYVVYQYWRTNIGEEKPEALTQKPMAQILAICPHCKNRIPSESKYCLECGTNLQPKKTT
jgi:uncharacterized membrane protein